MQAICIYFDRKIFHRNVRYDSLICIHQIGPNSLSLGTNTCMTSAQYYLRQLTVWLLYSDVCWSWCIAEVVTSHTCVLPWIWRACFSEYEEATVIDIWPLHVARSGNTGRSCIQGGCVSRRIGNDIIYPVTMWEAVGLSPMHQLLPRRCMLISP